jgi:hypothetical protein
MTAFARRAAVPVFTVAILSSAALIFVLQPLFARMTTPSLGGSPAVWNTSMVFFQAALLVGYGYAHLLTRLKDLRFQALNHASLLGLGALVLPLSVTTMFGAPNSATPQLWLMGVLAVSVGAPYAVACATAPLLQAWYARTGRADASDPYYLYAASNVGSLGGLIAYPLLIEPLAGLAAQRTAWSIGYGVVTILILAAAVLAIAAKGEAPKPVALPSARPAWRERLFWLATAAIPSSLLLGVTQHISMDVASAPFLWVVPLALYLITFIVAFARGSERLLPSLRFLLPISLGVLILSFAVFNNWPVLLGANLTCFFLAALACHLALAARRPEAARLTEFYLWVSLGGVIGGALTALLAPVIFNDVYEYPLALAAAGLIVARGGAPSRWTNLADAFGMGSLALLLPALLLFQHSAQVTALFCAAFGAAACLICAGLIARKSDEGDPRAVMTYAFFGLAVLFSGLMAAFTAQPDWLFKEVLVNDETRYTINGGWAFVVGAAGMTLLAFLIRTAAEPTDTRAESGPSEPATVTAKLLRRAVAATAGIGLAYIGLGVALAVWGAELRPATLYYASLGFIAAGLVLNGARPFVLAATVLVAFAIIYLDDNRNVVVIHQGRSFFGVVKVTDNATGDPETGNLRVLFHGTTIHGAQLTGEFAQLRPLTYYNPATSLGEATARAARAHRPAHLGLIGLGAGATACLLWNDDDDLTVFEIDPAVVRLSTGPRAVFSYVNECAHDARVVVGDARLSVTREPDATFDVLVVDAFSSDAIPAHLLTREAVATYMAKVRPDGAVVLHLSNRNLALVLEAARVAHELGLTAIWRTSSGDARAGVFGYGALPATTMVLARNPQALAAMRFHAGEWCEPPLSPGRAWSDDYINVPRALRDHFNGLEEDLTDLGRHACVSPPGLLPPRKRLE